MFKNNEIKSALLGCLEIALFMPKGIERFGTDIGAMWRSFILPILSMPLTFIALTHMQNATPELTEASYITVAGLFFIRGIFTIILGLGILYAFSKAYDRMQYFCLAITIGNWTTVISTVLFLPILLSMMLGWHNWEDVYPFSLILTMYTYIFGTFAMTYALRIPWEMAGFLTIIGLAINQTSLDGLLWITDKIT